MSAHVPCASVSTAKAAVVVAAHAAARVVPIAEARRSPLGTVVTIEGSVTVPSATFRASISDEGFAVQDGSGGIYVSMTTSLGLRLHERVRVTGRVAESLGLLVVVPVDTKAVQARGRGAQVTPLNVRTGRISETTEGRLLRVSGMITRAVVSDLPYGHRVFINDGSGEVQVFVSASTRIDTSGLRAGQRIRVTGFGGQYKDHYEVSPRFAPDIALGRGRARPAP